MTEASSVAVKSGWVAAEVRGQSGEVSAVVEAGYRPTVNLGLYGDVWWKPGIGQGGTDFAVRYRNSVDLYAGAWVDSSRGTVGGQAGVKWKF